MLGLIIVFLISFFGTLIVRKGALKKNIIDIPNERSSHSVATPRGGGLAIAVAWFIAVIWMFVNNQLESSLFYALLAGVLLVLIGVLDDIYNIKPLLRFIIQFISVSIGLYFINGLNKVDLGFITIDSIYILTPIAVIGLIWFINLFNFLDGIDGYASSEAIFISIAFYTLIGDNLLLFLAFSVAGFLVLNWQPAKIFMGDVGSTLLGFLVGLLSIHYSNIYDISILTLLIPSSLFWFDATITLYRRWRNKEKLSQAHKKHFYQRLVQSGFSHQRTVLFGMGINLILFGITFFAIKVPKFSLLFFFLAILILFTIERLLTSRILNS